MCGFGFCFGFSSLNCVRVQKGVFAVWFVCKELVCGEIITLLGVVFISVDSVSALVCV